MYWVSADTAALSRWWSAVDTRVMSAASLKTDRCQFSTAKKIDHLKKQMECSNPGFMAVNKHS